MKYKKGTFVIVPNLDELKGKPSEMQAIYLWICQHSDSDGVCFPKKSTISREAGCSHNTVDKYLKQLVDDGFLEIKQRKTEDGKNTSNEYQLLILGRTTPQNRVGSHPKIGSQTISNITIPNITTIIGNKTLPIDRGKLPHQRIDTIYGDMFKDKYGFYPSSTNIGGRLKVFKELLKQYSELQIAWLLIVYFDYEKEKTWFEKKNYDVYTFKFNIDKFVAYTLNESGYKDEYNNSDNLLPIIAEIIINMKKI